MTCVAVLLVLAIGYLAVALLTFVVCAAFGFEWSWLTALGVWAAIILIRMALHGRGE